jgi:FixJ family two-component response regulator
MEARESSQAGIARDATVFVVDDDPEVRGGLSRLFESVGLSCRTFESARQFLDGYDPGQRGCLLLDIRIPGMSGMELHRQLVERGIRIPVIIVTGHGDILMAVEAMKRGAVTFLEKPVRPQQLVDHAYEALRQDAWIREADRQHSAIQQRLAALTDREREVLDRLVAGRTVKEVAADLGLSPKTIDFHRGNIMDKMEVRTIADLVRAVMTVKDDACPPAACSSA